MTLLTALEISSNYPDNILIDTCVKDGKWTSLLYMTRGKYIHKLMLSFNDFPFDSKEIAVSKMQEVIDAAIKYIEES